MDQLSDLFTGLPDVARDALLRARSIPDLGLAVIGLAALIALLSRSVIAIILAALILWIPAVLLLTNAADDRSWLVLWIACAASLLATGIAFTRRRLAKQTRALQKSAPQLRQELEDLRTSYEHVIRGAGGEIGNGSQRPFTSVPRASQLPIR
jgi:hypothetical protein